MDLFGINGYNLSKRAALVLEHGVFIAERHTDRYRMVLYHMGEFYAEMWYHQPGNNVVLVRGFTDEAYLEPFLALVDISALPY